MQQIPPERSHLYKRRLDVSIGFTAGDLERNGWQEMSSLFGFSLKQLQHRRGGRILVLG